MSLGYTLPGADPFFGCYTCKTDLSCKKPCLAVQRKEYCKCMYCDGELKECDIREKTLGRNKTL